MVSFVNLITKVLLIDEKVFVSAIITTFRLVLQALFEFRLQIIIEVQE